MMKGWGKREWALANIHFENNVSPKLNNVSTKLDSHRATDPLLTELQEIIFDLYDEKKYQQARKLESVEEMIIKEVYKNKY